MSGEVRKVKSMLAAAGSLMMGAILLVAAWSKSLDPLAFARQIENEGLAIVLSGFQVALVALALEVFLGVALVLMLRYRVILGATSALVVFFLFLTGRAYWRFLNGVVDEEGSCGCFGNLVERTPAEAFWQDLFLMVIPMALAWLAPVAVEKSAHLWRWIVVAASTLAITIFAFFAPGLPIDDFATKLRPGVSLETLCAGGGDDRAPVCFDAVLPEGLEGDHLIVLSALDQELGRHIDALNERFSKLDAPQLWIVTSDSEESQFAFRFGFGPAFEPREAPQSLLKPLYRELPRSFEVVDGVVVKTHSGLPPGILEHDTLSQ